MLNNLDILIAIKMSEFIKFILEFHSKMEPGPKPDKIDWKVLFQNGQLYTIQNPVTGDVYTLTKFLGQGGFGTVFKATSQQLNQDVALKLMEIRSTHNEEDFLEEKTAYVHLSQAPTCQLYIVCMIDAFTFDYNGRKIGAIITQLMDGDLNNLPPADEEIVALLKALIDGLSYIHANGFAHRDLKPGNILRKGKLFKIGDLGLICDTNMPEIPSCSHAGTPIFSSPISVQTWGQKVSLEDEQKEDIWSLGMTLYALIFGNFPSEIRTEQDVATLTQEMVNQFLNRNTPYPRTPPTTISGRDIIFLVSRMLKVDPNERWDIERIRQYFNSHLRTPMQQAQPQPQPRRIKYHPDLARLLAQHQDLARLLGQYGFQVAPPVAMVGADGQNYSYDGIHDTTDSHDDDTDDNEFFEPEEDEPEEEAHGKHEPTAVELDTAELCRIMAQAFEYYNTDPEFAQDLIDIVEEYVDVHELDFDYLRDCWETMADGLDVQQKQGTCSIRQDQMRQMLNHLESLGQQ
jgi:serine/threonine protein kinase